MRIKKGDFIWFCIKLFDPIGQEMFGEGWRIDWVWKGWLVMDSVESWIFGIEQKKFANSSLKNETYGKEVLFQAAAST